MFIVFLLLITLSFAYAMKSMEPQNNSLLKFDSTEIYCSDYVYNFGQRSINQRPSIDSNKKIQQLLDKYTLLRKNHKRFKRVHAIEGLSEEFKVTTEEKRRFLKEVFTLELNGLNDEPIKNMFEKYYVYFPVDTFCWNENGDRALHLAVRKKSPGLARYLVQKLKASSNVLNDLQETPVTILEGFKNGQGYKGFKGFKKVLDSSPHYIDPCSITVIQ